MKAWKGKWLLSESSTGEVRYDAVRQGIGRIRRGTGASAILRQGIMRLQ
jgi:hypothetical protein